MWLLTGILLKVAVSAELVVIAPLRAGFALVPVCSTVLRVQSSICCNATKLPTGPVANISQGRLDVNTIKELTAAS